MYPILFEWNGFIIPAWHFFYMLAALAGLFFLFHLNLKWNINLDASQVSGLYASSYIGGYFGARGLSIIVDEWSKINSFHDFLWLLFSFGPMTFYGGMFGASLASSYYAHRNKISLLKITDLGIPCGLLGLCIGRIGCFFNGDDYGIPIPESLLDSPPWWSVSFPNHFEQIPRVPIQLIESLLVLLLIGSIYLVKVRFPVKITPGLCGVASAIFYAFIRFPVEYFRGDQRGWVVQDHLSTSQFLSLIIIIGLAPIFYLMIAKKNKL